MMVMPKKRIEVVVKPTGWQRLRETPVQTADRLVKLYGLRDALHTARAHAAMHAPAQARLGRTPTIEQILAFKAHEETRSLEGFERWRAIVRLLKHRVGGV